MAAKKNHRLVIDPEFRDLIPALQESERKILEENLMKEGCRDPIAIWNGVILDGHNRYDICRRRGIPFTTVEVPVYSREEALAWICANQLGKRNISEETRRYLIGKRYTMEKMIGAHNPSGRNQHSKEEVRATMLPEPHMLHFRFWVCTVHTFGQQSCYHIYNKGFAKSLISVLNRCVHA